MPQARHRRDEDRQTPEEKNGAGHAILTVKTDKGEFILDNQAETIKLWSETEYRFVKRQSQSDPNRWVSLGDPRPAGEAVWLPDSGNTGPVRLPISFSGRPA